MTREGGCILHLLSDYQMDKGSIQSLSRSEYFKKRHSVLDSMERDRETYISCPALMTKKRIMSDFL